MPIGRGVLSGKPQTSAGKRNKFVTIEQLDEPVTGTRFPKEHWSTLATVYMSRRDILADERFAAAQESAYKVTQWHGDYRADMDPDLVDVTKKRRLNYLGRIYNIRSASVIGDRRGIECITLGA